MYRGRIAVHLHALSKGHARWEMQLPAYRLEADLPLELRAANFSLLHFRHSPLSSMGNFRNRPDADGAASEPTGKVG